MANQHPVTDYPDGKLYEALRIARVPDRLANAAEKEVRDMAGSNIFVRLDALDKRQDEVIRSVRWGFGIGLSLFAMLFSVFFGVLTFMFDRLTP